jgi:hypothetical protein
MEDFKISQLTKEIISEKLRQLPDACRAAADLYKQTLRVALAGLEAGSAADNRVVGDACQGAMTALLLKDHSLPKGAALILEATVELAAELNLDQVELMRSAVKGIADMRRFVPEDKLHDIREAIDAQFNGVGAAFDGFCAEAAPQDGSSARKI